MSNMSYCRFHNTLQDLRECAEAINDRETLSSEEAGKRTNLIRLCAEILESIGIDVDSGELQKAIKELNEDCAYD